VDVLNALFRWIHILAGIIWIGMLYFFNFVNGPFQGTLDGDTKKKVNPELLPRALWWFRWGAVYTVVTGILLLMLVFYHGGIMFDGDRRWGLGPGVMVALVFVAPGIYDALHKSLGKDPKVFGAISFVGAAHHVGRRLEHRDARLGAAARRLAAAAAQRRHHRHPAPAQQRREGGAHLAGVEDADGGGGARDVRGRPAHRPAPDSASAPGAGAPTGAGRRTTRTVAINRSSSPQCR
jgi:hypothetical protein